MLCQSFYLKKKKKFFITIVGNKNGRGMRLSTYDPDDPISNNGQLQQTYNSLDNSSRLSQNSNGQRVSTISNNYTEKTMLLSSDEEN